MPVFRTASSGTGSFMTYLIQVPIADATAEGADFFVMEVDGQVDRGVVRSGRPGQVVTTAAETFEAALERLQPLTRAIIVKLRGIVDGPEEIGVEFGLKMNLEAGLVVARATSEANFTVTLRWKRA
jgi:hypothetical protein